MVDVVGQPDVTSLHAPENEYHPHFVQADREPDQHRNEMDEDGS